MLSESIRSDTEVRMVCEARLDKTDNEAGRRREDGSA